LDWRGRVVSSGARTEQAQMADEKKRTAPRRTRDKVKVIGDVIAKMEAKLTSEELKPSVGDFIRLLQFEKELKEEQPREIEVSWVEPENAPGK
jgi:hypothetical protein